jgi:hypothetical protein
LTTKANRIAAQLLIITPTITFHHKMVNLQISEYFGYVLIAEVVIVVYGFILGIFVGRARGMVFPATWMKDKFD